MVATRIASEATSLAAGALMAAMAAARRGKAVHPHGVVHRARLVVPGRSTAPAAASLLSTPGEHDAVVRFSRSLGIPRPLPDLLGFALRVLDAYGEGRHQDLLMVSTVDLPVLHHGFVPSAGPSARPYTSSLPYRAGSERFLVGVVPGRGDGRFDLATAALSGRFRPVAEIHLGERLPGEADALRFNPWNTGGGLQPDGLLNRWRRRAYPMSQAGWAATRGGARADQLRADALTGSTPTAPAASGR